MNHAARILAAAGAMVVAWLLANPPHPAEIPDALARRLPPREELTRPLRGMAIQLHGSGPEHISQHKKLIDELAEMGANSVLLVNHGWQTHAGTADLHLDPQRNPSMPELTELCAHAVQRGMSVTVMPVVLLSAPRGSEWRGRINPTVGWDEWFRRYTQFIIEHARAAESGRASVLMIGSELIKAEQHTDKWAALIAEVRKVFKGKLGYSANWDHYSTEKIGFWPLLDCVGMTSYYTLADAPNPTVESLVERWKPIQARILKFHNEVRRPIIFTEAGWCSQEGAASESWNYYHNMHATPEGHAEQANCYRAFLKTWEDQPAVLGVYWWEWNPYPGGPADFGYTPRDKPAELLLREWFARGRQADAAAR